MEGLSAKLQQLSAIASTRTCGTSAADKIFTGARALLERLEFERVMQTSGKLPARDFIDQVLKLSFLSTLERTNLKIMDRTLPASHLRRLLRRRSWAKTTLRDIERVVENATTLPHLADVLVELGGRLRDGIVEDIEVAVDAVVVAANPVLIG